MARKKFTELTENETLLQVTCVDDLIANYVAKKQELDALDKVVKKLAEQVKEQMKSQDLKSTLCNGYKVTRMESQRITWNEEALLQKVKMFNQPELIRQVEQVDVAMLQQAIINEQIDINDLQDCQTVKDIVSLRVDKVKEKAPDEL